ncbi:MAG: hypothetical protein H0W75_12525, partial [Chitinophagaceae bacterium]|nr:hypothetical protein [Chitinophagaceae bacterium]
DKVLIYLSENQASQLKNLYELILQHLEDLLSHIEHRYQKYFNPEEKVPEIYLRLSLADIRKKINTIRKAFAKKADEKLLQIIVTPLSLFIKKKNISYRELMYIKELVRCLTEVDGVDKVNTVSSILSEVTELLVYMNFNCSTFVSYLLTQIEDAINALHEQYQKTERLMELQKEFNQMQLKPGAVFKIHAHPVKEQVTTWISEELFYLEQKQRLISIAPALHDDAIIAEEEKLHLSASVEVLTLLARSAKDSKLILNKQMTVMFRNLAKFCRTTRAENPTAKSMLTKSYVAGRNNKLTAINILHEMIKWIHKY